MPYFTDKKFMTLNAAVHNLFLPITDELEFI